MLKMLQVNGFKDKSSINVVTMFRSPIMDFIKDGINGFL